MTTTSKHKWNRSPSLILKKDCLIPKSQRTRISVIAEACEIEGHKSQPPLNVAIENIEQFSCVLGATHLAGARS